MKRVLALAFALSLLIAAGSATSAEARNRHQFFRTYNGFFSPCPAYSPSNCGRYLRPGDQGPFAARIAQLRALMATTRNPQAQQVYAREIYKLRALQLGY